jgi:ribosome recycling factor
MDELFLETEERMQKAVDHLAHEFAGLRTGKASPALVEGVMVEAYGSQMRLRDVANVAVPEARQIVIQPYDISTIQAIEKGIQKANLGLNPAVDGKVLRLVMPEMSEERRVEVTKIARKVAEETRVAVRHARRDAIDQLKKQGKSGELTEDDVAKGEKEVQKLTDSFVSKVDDLLAAKEKEIMTI